MFDSRECKSVYSPQVLFPPECAQVYVVRTSADRACEGWLDKCGKFHYTKHYVRENGKWSELKSFDELLKWEKRTRKEVRV